MVVNSDWEHYSRRGFKSSTRDKYLNWNLPFKDEYVFQTSKQIILNNIYRFLNILMGQS